MPDDPNGNRATAVDWLKRRRQVLVDIYIFLVTGVWVGWQTHKTWAAGTMGYVEAAFTAQSVVMVCLFLFRRRHTGLDRNLLHQGVAVAAYFSGLAFLGQPSTAGPSAQAASNAVTGVAHVLGLLSLLNLGRSFGVLVAVRKLQTRGLYSAIRHPMYLSDILFRVGFTISHFGWVTGVLFVGSGACYVYRALIEEKFLGQQVEYQEYMKKVKYRFIPFVF